ncbi:penicillin-binding protein activator [Herbaspirillum sp. GCM10030257]|uniref:penicillin-binding protein activator n=1 Tax=Herbaspirillum sp. GCM10030257 TaxID=3273393 RepID=UPI00361D035D
MLSQMARAGVLIAVLSGFCLPLAANTTVAEAALLATPVPVTGKPLIIAQTDLSIPREAPVYIAPRQVRIGLLLPLQSQVLGPIAEAVRAGVQAAYEREPEGVEVSVVDSGEAPQDVLTRYQEAATMNDIVVGPLTRTGVAAVAQSGSILKPTIALAQPESASDAPVTLPPQMLVMGLSIEDEARQVATWAARDNPGATAIVLHTGTAWQRRAASAFEAQWQKNGKDVQLIELPSNDGFLNGRSLLQLKKDVPPDRPIILFAALDARQARQVHAVMGNAVTMYGTSQINPYTLTDRMANERAPDMDGTRLLDMPWQLEPDHPAVMVYPRLVVAADQRRTADMERFYALGIDAYRVARELALQNDQFQIDGVTGKLIVQFDGNTAHIDRVAQRAVYRDGSVTPIPDVIE